MLALPEQHATIEDAGRALLPFALQPDNWLACSAEDGLDESELPTLYQCQVDGVRICAVVQVSGRMSAELHVLFRSPGLTLLRSADLLERFLRGNLSLSPNSEWRVEADEHKGVRFFRRYASTGLLA